MIYNHFIGSSSNGNGLDVRGLARELFVPQDFQLLAGSHRIRCEAPSAPLKLLTGHCHVDRYALPSGR
jgi:hypothetical protein